MEVRVHPHDVATASVVVHDPPERYEVKWTAPGPATVMLVARLHRDWNRRRVRAGTASVGGRRLRRLGARRDVRSRRNTIAASTADLRPRPVPPSSTHRTRHWQSAAASPTGHAWKGWVRSSPRPGNRRPRSRGSSRGRARRTSDPTARVARTERGRARCACGRRCDASLRRPRLELRQMLTDWSMWAATHRRGQRHRPYWPWYGHAPGFVAGLLR